MKAPDLGRELLLGRLTIERFGIRCFEIRCLAIGRVRALFWVCAAGVMAACGSESGAEPEGETDPVESATEGDDSGTEPPPQSGEEFEAAYAVMKERCSECHKAGTPHSFVVGANADATLSSATAAHEKIEMRINAPAGADRMPPTGPLPASELATINAWLDSL